MTAFELPPSLAPAEQLAFEEAALDHVEQHGGPGFLWFWESPVHWVVVGYGQSAAREVHLDACRAEGVPVLRRCSGGGTVVQGPGCLNYGLALDAEAIPELASITGTNRWIMERQRRALATLLHGNVEVRGHTDLVVDGRKFSGNAQRRKRRGVLFHGTFLREFDLGRIARWLPFPSAQPDYRADRTHLDFVINTGLPAASIRKALLAEWDARFHSAPPQPVLDRIPALLEARYAHPAWHLGR